MINGTINAHFSTTSTSKRIRSGIGVVTSERIVFVISRGPVTFHEFATIFRDNYRCTDALYLDGEISAFYPNSGDNQSVAHDFAGLLGVTRKQ